MIHVCWHEGTDGFAHAYGRSGYSCCTLLNQMFDQYACLHWSTFAHLPAVVKGAVVVIHGGNERDRVATINRELATLSWVIVIIIGDEGSDFPVDQLHLPPRSRVWVQSPEPGKTLAHRFFPMGFSRDTPHFSTLSAPRDLDWFFAGQDTHLRRHQCIQALRTLPRGVVIPTCGFMQGVEHREYFAYMAQAKVIPCPSGPASPDTLRMAEALELGCVPLVDVHTPRYPQDTYWQTVFEGPVPFPLVTDWQDLPQLMTETLADWDGLTLRCQTWWRAYKQEFFSWLKADITCLTT